MVSFRALKRKKRQALPAHDQRGLTSDVCEHEILPRLPTKDVQTFKTICKDWHKLISTSSFVKLHLEKSNRGRIRVLMPIPSAAVMIEYKNYYNNYEDKYYEEIKLIPFPLDFSLVGSCDGLLCLLHTGHIYSEIPPKLAVFNPSTGKCIGVQLCPQLSQRLLGPNFCKIICSWFGHLSSSEEYIFVLGLLWVEHGRLCGEVGVYKFTGNSTMEPIHSTYINPQFPLPLLPDRGVLLHGALHWPATLFVTNVKSHLFISAYNLGTNKHVEISPPVQCDFRIGVAEGCLCAIFKPTSAERCEFEMWIMKEYGVEQSWIKYANIEGFSSYRALSPLGFFPNGDLILDVDRYLLIKYSFDDNKAMLLMNHDNDRDQERNTSVVLGPEYFRYEAIVCADSLVSPTMFGESNCSCLSQMISFLLL